VALNTEELDAHAAQVARDGYTIVENAIDLALCDELVATLARLTRELGIQPSTNRFEGTRTTRIYNLLAHGSPFEQIPVHEHVLAICERVLDDGLLISSLSSIAIGPGEIAQPIHADDQVMPLPRPHPAVVCNSMWALTDFTDANGATRLMPGTHLADSVPAFNNEHETIPAEMSRGSVLIWHGSLWHGGGANQTNDVRIGIAMNYCAGYIRQQENQQLGVPLEVARTFSPRLQELCGFGVYRGLIGHVNKHAPREVVLGDAAASRMLWDGEARTK
jgi:ectoine hydroxylase-related dioxygenase (phytanoyl-CoA dioxygenase family)